MVSSSTVPVSITAGATPSGVHHGLFQCFTCIHYNWCHRSWSPPWSLLKLHFILYRSRKILCLLVSFCMVNRYQYMVVYFCLSLGGGPTKKNLILTKGYSVNIRLHLFIADLCLLAISVFLVSITTA